MTTEFYTDRRYFANGRTVEWARYVDDKANGGNANGKVDGKEIQLFKDIIKHRYDFDYSFEKLDSEQVTQFSIKNNNIRKSLYLKDDLLGPSDLGSDLAVDLIGSTNINERKEIKNILHEAATFPVQMHKKEVLKEIFNEYREWSAGGNGLFQQIGTEWASKEQFTNKEVLEFLKAIMDSIPEDDKYSDDYGYINDFYKEYSQRDPEERFTNHGFWNNLGRVFGADRLDNLDEAVKNVLNR